MQNHPAELDWKDGQVPISTRFDDPYFSLADGLAETRHVFLSGNDLPTRFAAGFHVAELGFGTGLNLLATWSAWETAKTPGPLQFTSFEAFPMETADMARSLAAFPEMAPYATRFFAAWDGRRCVLPELRFEMMVGDARDTLPRWDGQADAWYLDGFSPAKNPELWEQSLLQAVHDHTTPDGSAATYTAAGFVRRGLADAGFAVERAPGFGRKRHMTRARRQ